MNETFNPESNKESTVQAVPQSLFPRGKLKQPWLTVLSALAAGILLMFTWWGFDGVGLRMGLSVVIIGVLFSVNTVIQQKKLKVSTLALLLLTIAASLVSVFRQEFVTKAISMMVSPIGLLLLSSDFMNGQWWLYRIREYFRSAFLAMVAFFVGLPVLLAQAFRQNKNRTATNSQGKKIAFGVLKGILIAIPILIIFTLLFSFADSIFESKVDSFVEWLRTDFLAELAGRVFMSLFFGWLAAAGLWLSISDNGQKIDLEDDKPLVKPFLGMTETAIVLVSINLLFAFFLVIQFQYFFAGQANINLEGFTYAEYARRGFTELLWVAAIAGALYYLLASFTRRESTPKRLLFSALGAVLLLQVGVVLVSAYQRINLYVEAYGLTEIRLVPQIFTYFLAAILAALVIMEVTGEMKRFALVLLAAFVLFSFTLAGINIDRTIARVNVRRAAAGEELDYQLLTYRLSEDADPYLYEVLDSGTLPPQLQQNLAKVMVCRSVIFEKTRGLSSATWLEWNLPTIKAQRLHEDHLSLRETYEFDFIDIVHNARGFQIEDVDLICN